MWRLTTGLILLFLGSLVAGQSDTAMPGFSKDSQLFKKAETEASEAEYAAECGDCGAVAALRLPRNVNEAGAGGIISGRFHVARRRQQPVQRVQRRRSWLQRLSRKRRDVSAVKRLNPELESESGDALLIRRRRFVQSMKARTHLRRPQRRQPQRAHLRRNRPRRRGRDVNAVKRLNPQFESESGDVLIGRARRSLDTADRRSHVQRPQRRPGQRSQQRKGRPGRRGRDVNAVKRLNPELESESGDALIGRARRSVENTDKRFHIRRPIIRPGRRHHNRNSWRRRQ